MISSIKALKTSKESALLLSSLLLGVFSISKPAEAVVISGEILDWPESSASSLEIGDGINSVSLSWSVNTVDRGFFYGSIVTGDSDVALATDVTDVAQISDASVYDFTDNVIGPLCDADCDSNGVGSFTVWKNIETGHFGVL